MADAFETEKLRRMLPAELARIAFGVRYDPQLKLLDRIGTVMDEILKAEGTPFGAEQFPLSEIVPMQYRLLNTEENSELLINSQDTILQMPLRTRDAARVIELGRVFQEYVLQPLKRQGNVKNIARYGLLLHFDESKAATFANPPIARYLSSDFPKASTLAMRFGRRVAVEEALAKKRVDDYRNVIYTVDQNESGAVHFSIDYQDYFQPFLDTGEWSDRPFSAFVSRGVEYVEGEFQRWLKTFSTASEVA